MTRTLIKIIALCGYCLFVSSIALAERESPEPSPFPRLSHGDDRLPPILPGEEVSNGNQKMKVWSTGGGVELGTTTNDPTIRQGNQPPSLPSGVIVDDRSPGKVRDHSYGNNPR